VEEDLLIVKLVEEELQQHGRTSEDRKAVINAAWALQERLPYFSRYKPEGLRSIYCQMKPMFMKMHELFGNSPEFANPNVVPNG
jgi:hypothetical protein